MNIKYYIGKGFGYIERAYSMGVNDYFCPIRTNIKHATPRYAPRNLILGYIITYRHIVLQKNLLIYEENWKNQVKK